MPKCKDLSHIPKYANRKSPPADANATGCRGVTAVGNDGKDYKSTRQKNGKYVWKKVTALSGLQIVSYGGRKAAPKRRVVRALQTYTPVTRVVRATPMTRIVRVTPVTRGVAVYRNPFVNVVEPYSPLEFAVAKHLLAQRQAPVQTNTVSTQAGNARVTPGGVKYTYNENYTGPSNVASGN